MFSFCFSCKICDEKVGIDHFEFEKLTVERF
jgi:hypothetical protein